MEHVGCYRDQIRDRAMSHLEYAQWRNPQSKTVEDCFQACRAGGYYYMGYQFQRQCFCAHQTEDVRRHGKADNCQNGKGGVERGNVNAAFDLYQVAHGNLLWNSWWSLVIPDFCCCEVSPI